MTLKILTVLGTRPEAIKLAPVIKTLQEYARRMPTELKSFICVTAQHRHMLDQMLAVFDLVPDYDLDSMQNGQSPIQTLTTILERLSTVLTDLQPDWVLVQGDTMTTVAAALCAFYAHIQIGHIEAGLRTHQKYYPFPEEINRCLTSSLADLHFAPTEQARQNLLREGVSEQKIFVTGNTIIDALDWVTSNPSKAPLLNEIPMPHSSQRIVLVTTHRRENFGVPLEQVCLALQDLTNHYGQHIHFFYPVHLNPMVFEPVHQYLKDMPMIRLLPPLDYCSFIQLMQQCCLIITDSGGVQEEASYFGVPVLLLRETTERREGVDTGIVTIVGTDRPSIVHAARSLLDGQTPVPPLAQTKHIYGDGQASQRIVQTLLARHQH